ncbi:probable phosphoglycerate mutase [Cognatiyoonia koreensis]|uniref:Probable phosphoglycerate mutase n=1 Tax=Cognatiyoonia koreensis TaxID=364200 RepID=A0A1I0PPQ2_9RHOB|nr:histidine phosphatase family protein [Cognatiyoonia koreensis]SEW16390.1 probable phosphoglycerate mutase [Cognatiyoonia koreensis]
MPYPELYILRHGETIWNAEGRMQGALNSPLTERGKGHATKQAALLSDIDLTGFQILCSPQGRAFETASIALARKVPFIRTDDRLCEIGVGDWQGKLRHELQPDQPLDDGPDGPVGLYELAPNGEGFERLEARCLGFLSDLASPAVLVTHGITSRMLRSIIVGRGRSGVAEMPGGQGNIFHLKNGVQKQLG